MCTNHEVSPEPFPCEICGLVLATFDLLKQHTTSCHTETKKTCKYCDYTTDTKEDQMEHLIKEHEDVVILHTTACQVDTMTNKLESLDNFKLEVMSLLEKLLYQ